MRKVLPGSSCRPPSVLHNPSPKAFLLVAEGVGMGQWGLPRSCTQALPAGRFSRIGEGVNQFEENKAG